MRPAWLPGVPSIMDNDTRECFDQVNQRLNRIDQRLGEADKRFNEIGQRLNRIDQRFEAIDRRMDRFDQRMDQFDRRMDRIEVRIETEARETRREFTAGLNLVLERIGDMIGAIDDKYKDLPRRVARLEDHVFGRREG